MGDEAQRGRMKLDLPEYIIRAIRVRAAFDGVNPGDVVTAALEVYLQGEIETVKARMGQGDAGKTDEPPKPRKGK